MIILIYLLYNFIFKKYLKLYNFLQEPNAIQLNGQIIICIMNCKTYLRTLYNLIGYVGIIVYYT